MIFLKYITSLVTVGDILSTISLRNSMVLSDLVIDTILHVFKPHALTEMSIIHGVPIWHYFIII